MPAPGADVKTRFVHRGARQPCRPRRQQPPPARVAHCTALPPIRV